MNLRVPANAVEPGFADVQTGSVVRLSRPLHGGELLVDGQMDAAPLVRGGLPGELVRIRAEGRRRGVHRAVVEQVLEASQHRSEPLCPYFGTCGGCQWQHAAYGHQLEIKSQVVADLWRREGMADPVWQLDAMDDPWHYRIRGEFHAVQAAGCLKLGFNGLRSHRALAIDHCLIHDDRINKAIAAWTLAAQAVPLEELNTVLFTVEPQGHGLLWQPRFYGPRRSAPDQFAQAFADALDDVVLLDEAISIPLNGMLLRVSSDSFVQANFRQMLILYRRIVELLRPAQGDLVLDIYCGVGAISLELCRQGARVTGVEQASASTTLARLNARINAQPLTVLEGSAEVVLRQLAVQEHRLAVVDPPRAGLSEPVLTQLIRLQPDRLVYVSCNPATQVRDLKRLLVHGYRVTAAHLVDMFPWTAQIETVVRVER